jgi:hypothetical protein
MKRLLALLLSYASIEAKSIVTDDYLDKVAMVESNYNYDAIGDKGKAFGAWQMHEASWRESCQYLDRNNYACVYSWEEVSDNHKIFAKDPDISRLVSRTYLQILEKQMLKAKIKVTPIGLYMAYNMGFCGAYNNNFSHTYLWLDNKRKGILARANQILSR